SETGQNAIIERSLHGVDVPAIEIDMDHAVGPLQEGDRSAGLCIALEVRQIVIFGESLVLGGRAKTPGHIKLAPVEVLPEVFADTDEFFVPQFISKISDRTVQIHRAYGMP